MSSYQTALTIAEVMIGIKEKKYLLPSIQREFVWDQKQIETLFDSLMRDYPINSFLFWEVPETKMKDFRFYEFLRDYHQKDNRHNPVSDTDGLHGLTAILDGQQRMTSIYIGLMGTYAAKLPYLWWNNPRAYPKKRLFLNLLPNDELLDNEYDFRFLTEEESKDNAGKLWFRVGDVLDFQEDSDVSNYLLEKVFFAGYSQEEGRRANNTLHKLYSVIHEKGTISPYIVKTDDLDKVLNIFIRVNSGGTPLSYSDLLLSFATAQWDNLDAREEINSLVDELNRIGGGFNISKDLVLKASLALCDIPNIRFKVDNFNRRNMMQIEERWEDIKMSLHLTLELIASFGFNRDNISANNALIPIAYYLLQIGNPRSYVEASRYDNDRQAIRLWFISTILLHTFSTSPDQLLTQLREIIRRDHDDGFPADRIRTEYAGTYRSMSFNEDGIKNLLNTKNINGETLIVLSLVYPWADLQNYFHIDHVHPKSKFKKRVYDRMGLTEESRFFYAEHMNSLANLQLLPSVPNKEKSDMPFAEWMELNYSDALKRKNYMELHCIPDVDFSFDNFHEFFKRREQLIFERLKKILPQ